MSSRPTRTRCVEAIGPPMPHIQLTNGQPVFVNMEFECPICLEGKRTDEMWVLGCGHAVCDVCTTRLVNRCWTPKCPLCRTPIIMALVQFFKQHVLLAGQQWSIHEFRREELVLSRKDVKNLPNSFGNLDRLKRLRLDGNQLNSLPESFGNLVALELLDLSANQLATLPESFGRLGRLATLDLYGNPLTMVPPSFHHLHGLLNLNLSKTGLSDSSSLQNLPTTLKSLYLFDNVLSDLPLVPPFFKNLTLLSLEQNQFNNVEFVRSLKSIQTLILKNNAIETLPSSIGNLSSLTKLNLDINQLESLPPEFGNLTALQKLNLDNNQLESLPNEFGKLTALQKLNLDNNQLESLPNEFGKLTALQKLNLSDNNLESLPRSFTDLTSLERLWLGGNKNLQHPPISLWTSTIPGPMDESIETIMEWMKTTTYK